MSGIGWKHLHCRCYVGVISNTCESLLIAWTPLSPMIFYSVLHWDFSIAISPIPKHTWHHRNYKLQIQQSGAFIISEPNRIHGGSASVQLIQVSHVKSILWLHNCFINILTNDLSHDMHEHEGMKSHRNHFHITGRTCGESPRSKRTLNDNDNDKNTVA